MPDKSVRFVRLVRQLEPAGSAISTSRLTGSTRHRGTGILGARNRDRDGERRTGMLRINAIVAAIEADEPPWQLLVADHDTWLG